MAVTNFIWDELSDNVLLETDETDALTARYTNRPEQFGKLLSQYRIEDEKIVERFYHYDGESSTSALTDAIETVTDTFIYTAFGEEVARTGTTTNPFGYKGAVGYYTNPETSDIYVRARTYEPALGCWLSVDPLGSIDGPNLYRAYFVPGGIDPSGLMTVTPDPAWGNLEAFCGSHPAAVTWAGLDNGQLNNKDGGRFIQKLQFGCEIFGCSCLPIIETCDITIYEVYRELGPGLSSGKGTDEAHLGYDVWKPKVNDGLYGRKVIAAELRFISNSKLDPKQIGKLNAIENVCPAGLNYCRVGSLGLLISSKKPTGWDNYTRAEGRHCRRLKVNWDCCGDETSVGTTWEEVNCDTLVWIE